MAEDPSPGEMPFPEEVARTQLTPPSGLPFHTATDESPGTEVRAQTAVPGAVTRGQTRPQQRLRGPAWVWASATVLALAVLAAGWFLHDRQLGEPATVTEFVALAEAAMAEDHWRADDGSGFVEITDEALRRFPGAPAIVELRNSASQRLLRRARDLQDTAPLEGARYAALARELASGAITNAASDSRSSSGEEDVSVVPSPEPVEDPFPSTRTTSSPAATGSAPAEEAVTPKSSRPATRTTPVPRTTPLPPPKPRPMPAPDNTSEPLDSFDTPPASTGGRWL